MKINATDKVHSLHIVVFTGADDDLPEEAKLEMVSGTLETFPTHPNHMFFVHQHIKNDAWVVSELSTGFGITEGYTTLGAITNTAGVLLAHKNKYEAALEKAKIKLQRHNIPYPVNEIV